MHSFYNRFPSFIEVYPAMGLRLTLNLDLDVNLSRVCDVSSLDECTGVLKAIRILASIALCSKN